MKQNSKKSWLAATDSMKAIHRMRSQSISSSVARSTGSDEQLSDLEDEDKDRVPARMPNKVVRNLELAAGPLSILPRNSYTLQRGLVDHA